MNILILDDYQEGIPSLPSMEKLKGHQVTVFTRPISQEPQAAEVLAEAEGLVLLRERSRVDEALLARSLQRNHISGL